LRGSVVWRHLTN